MNKVLIRYLVFALLAAGSAAAAFGQSSILDGRVWKLEAIGGRETGDGRARLEFDVAARRFTGSGGCNSISGSVSITRRAIRFGSPVMTRMYCGSPAGVMRTERSFVDALRRATRFSVAGDRLYLFAGRRELLRMVADEPADRVKDQVGLEDQKWILETIHGRPLPRLSQTPFIVFDPAKGSAGGNTSCNIFTGEYSAAGDRFNFKAGIMTMRACIEEPGNVQQRFLDALGAADRYEIEGSRLRLFEGRREVLGLKGVPRDKQ
ncbi:MAG: META domain-containing protein [Pyrinomonadaceae bacterium]